MMYLIITSAEDIASMNIRDKLLDMVDIKPEIIQDPSLMRPTDEPVIMGDVTKFAEETGWKQTIPIEKTLKDMLDFWREEIKEKTVI